MLVQTKEKKLNDFIDAELENSSNDDGESTNFKLISRCFN